MKLPSRDNELKLRRGATWRQKGSIIVPGRFVDGTELALPTQQVRGRFTMRKKNRFGNVIAEREFDNIVVNQGLDRLGSGLANIYGCCVVGTGTATPLATNTQLASYLGGTSTVAGSTGAGVAPNWESWVQGVYTFAVGAVVGNLTEVGVGSASTNTPNLFSRALILDGSGVPTSFPIAADEQLEVTYRLYLYPPLVDFTTTQTIGSTTYDVIIRGSRLASTTYWNLPPPNVSSSNAAFLQSASGGNNNAFSGAKVDPFGVGTPSGILGSITSTNAFTYTAGTYYRDGSLTFGPATANGAIKTIRVNRTSCEYQVEYQTPINKTNTQTLTVPFRLSWSRH